MTDVDLNVPKWVSGGLPNTREEQHSAALTVASRCTDVDDCRELLDMLGLRQELGRG